MNPAYGAGMRAPEPVNDAPQALVTYDPLLPSLALATTGAAGRVKEGGVTAPHAVPVRCAQVPPVQVVLGPVWRLRVGNPCGWVAHLVGLYFLDGQTGHLATPLDSTSTLLHAHTHFPPKLTVPELLWCCLTPTLLRLRTHTELWSGAQHDNHAPHLLALLNRESHQLAACGAACPAPSAEPLPHLLCAPLVLHYGGSLFVEPQLGLDAAYDDATTSAHFSGRRAHLLLPDYTIFQELLKADNIPMRAIKRAFAYGVLEWQRPRGPNTPMECQFCGTAEHQLSPHVRSNCSAAYPHLLRAQALFTHAAAPTSATSVTGTACFPTVGGDQC